MLGRVLQSPRWPVFANRFFLQPIIATPQRSSSSARPGLVNMLASDVQPPIQINTVTADGILLADGLLIPSACILLDGKAFLWDPPPTGFENWKPTHFQLFASVLPRPGA